MPIGRVVLLLFSLFLCSVLLGQAPQPANITIQRGLVYRTVADASLALDLYRPDGAAGRVPVILAIHGGSWVTGDRGTLRLFGEQFAGAGYAVVAPDYRLSPRWTFPAQLEDMRAATQWIRAQADAYGFDHTRLFVFGISAGGQLAALLGTQPETRDLFDGVMTVSAPYDFTGAAPSLRAKIVVQLYLGAEQTERPELYRAASPITYVAPEAPPFFIAHGTADAYVLPMQAMRMTDALRARQVPVYLQLLPGVEHAMPPADSPIAGMLLRDLLDFLHNPRRPSAAENTPGN